MSDLTRTDLDRVDIASFVEALTNPETPLLDRAAFYAVLQQIRLRCDRALKASRDDLIVGMERDGLKELGPLSIKSAAVDPKYVVNDPDNWEDSTIQDALAELRRDSRTRSYVRVIPAHLEIDPLALAADVQLGVQAAIDLYRAINEKRWRTEQARRLSLAVREVKAPRKEAA